MLRTYRFRPSTLLRGVSQGRRFDPVTLQKTSLELSSSDVNRRGVTGFLLYSKMLAKMSSLLLLISKNKGVYPVTGGVLSVLKSNLEQNFKGVTGYFFDPVTGGTLTKSKFERNLSCAKNPLPETAFFTGNSEGSRELRTDFGEENEIFNSNFLIWAGNGSKVS